MTNEQFENLLTEVAQDNLKDAIDVEAYVSAVLDEMYDGEGYGDFYHEIRGFHTKSGNPVVIS